MHSRGYAHNDIKTENISPTVDGKLLLIDLGFCSECRCDLGTGNKNFTNGTPQYLPPERHQRKPFCMKEGDIFALGVVLFMMAYGCDPFIHAKPYDLLYKHLCGKTPELFLRVHPKLRNLRKEDKLCPELSDLLVQMLRVDREERIRTVDAVREHPWMQGEQATREELAAELKSRLEKGL